MLIALCMTSQVSLLAPLSGSDYSDEFLIFSLIGLLKLFNVLLE